MCFYVRIVGRVAQNLVGRLCTDLADWIVLSKRRFRYTLSQLFDSYDDVGAPATAANPQPPHRHESNLVISLEDKPWFHNIDRKKAQELVTAGGNGCFVVRPSSTHPLTLTVFHGNRTYNVPIRRRDDGLIALGGRKQNERTFSVVEELINFHEKEEFILFSAGEESGRTILSSTPLKTVTEKEKKSNKTLDIYTTVY